MQDQLERTAAGWLLLLLLKLLRSSERQPDMAGRVQQRCGRREIYSPRHLTHLPCYPATFLDEGWRTDPCSAEVCLLQHLLPFHGWPGQLCSCV